MQAPEMTSDLILDRAASGYRTTLLSQATRVLCKAASVFMLARLVSPEEHGVFAMAASLTTILVLFRDLGLGAAALQAPILSAEQEASLFWAHVALGVALALATVGLAPLVVRFYAEPRVWPVLAAMSGSMVLLGLNGWPRVLLARQLQFTLLNRLETVAAAVATVAAISAGLLGAGPFAFVVFLIASEGIILLGVWHVCPWRPSGIPAWNSLRMLQHHGFYLTGHGVLISILQQLDLLLMGRFFGPHSLGLYSRPSQLLFLPLNHVEGPLGNVLTASLSRLGAGSSEYERHVRGTANLIAHLTLPVAAACLAIPDEVVLLLLGKAWLESAPLLQWLALTATASSLSATVYPICVSCGHSRRLVWMSTVALLTVAAGAWIGMQTGRVGLAAGVALANLALLCPRLWWATRGSPVRLAVLVQGLRGPVMTSVVAGLAMHGASLALGECRWGFRLAAAAAAGALAVLGLSLLWPALRSEWQAILKLGGHGHTAPKEDSR